MYNLQWIRPAARATNDTTTKTKVIVLGPRHGAGIIRCRRNVTHAHYNAAAPPAGSSGERVNSAPLIYLAPYIRGVGRV